MKTASSVADPTAAIDTKRRHVSAVGNDAERENRGGRDQYGREKMHDLVRARRDDIFLDQHLDPIGDRLKKPERPDAIRAVAILDTTENFPLEDGDGRENREKHTEQSENIEERRGDLNQPIGCARERRKQPLFSADEDLIDGLAHAR